MNAKTYSNFKTMMVESQLSIRFVSFFLLSRSTLNRKAFDIWVVCCVIFLILIWRLIAICVAIEANVVGLLLPKRRFILPFIYLLSVHHQHICTLMHALRTLVHQLLMCKYGKFLLWKTVGTFHFAIWLFYFIIILENDSFTLVLCSSWQYPRIRTEHDGMMRREEGNFLVNLCVRLLGFRKCICV